MNPILPNYQFLPAPLWLISALHILTLGLHFLAMNFLVGGVLMVLFHRASDRWSHPTLGTFLKYLPVAMAATITLGVAPLLFVQLVFPRQVYSASIVSGWFWLMVPAALLLAYYCLYAASFSKYPLRTGKFLALSVLGMLYVSLVYSSVFSLAEQPDVYKILYAADQSGLSINPEWNSWIVRWLHMIAGAVTVGGFFVGTLGRSDPEVSAAGRRFFIGGMTASFAIGLVYLLSPADTLQAVLRGGGLWILIPSVFLSLAAVPFFHRQKFLWTGALLFVSLLGMVATRHLIRLARLETHYNPATVTVSPQWGVFCLFLVCFLLALGALYYMVKLLLVPGKK